MNGWKALGFKTYKDYLMSDIWKSKREWFLDTYGRKCIRCGETTSLNVHHLTYKNVGNERSEDLICLCKNCHNKEHKIGEEEDAEICS